MVSVFDYHALGRGFAPHIDPVRNGQQTEGEVVHRSSVCLGLSVASIRTGQGLGHQCQLTGLVKGLMKGVVPPSQPQKRHWHFLGMYSDRTVRGSNRVSLRDVRPRPRTNRAVLTRTHANNDDDDDDINYASSTVTVPPHANPQQRTS